MKIHAPSGKQRSARLAIATAVLTASLCPTSAWALIVPPPPPAAHSCPAIYEVAMAAPALLPTKSEAILGGERSKLDELRAQQAAPVTVQEVAMLAPAAGPSTVTMTPCVGMAFSRLPTLDPQADPLVTPTLAAVSIARGPLSQPGLMLPKVDVSKPDVFGSIALSIGRTPLDSKWQRAQASDLSGRAEPWRAVVGEARGLDQGAKIELVNSWVNRRVSFIDDSVRFKVADRWATATETLRAGRGDCEDYAIAKMKLLEAAGVARGDMFLVIAKDLVRRADHALLVVRNGDRLMVLDNNTDRIVDAATIRDYRPVMSYSAGKAWLHGYATQPEVVQPTPIRIAALSS